MSSTEKVYIVIYEHRHGVDAWPIFSLTKPSEEEVIATMAEWEPDRGETIEIRGPWEKPYALAAW